MRVWCEGSDAVDNKPRAVIVVPCFNEMARLDRLSFLQFAHRHDSIEFVFVDDGSTDATASILEEIVQQSASHCQLLRLSRNCGKAEAVRVGMQRALERQPQYVGYWDADLATPLDSIPAFCAVLEQQAQINVVLGSRLPLLGHRIERNPWRAKLGQAFAFAASRVLRFQVRDTQCGAKLFRAGPYLACALDQPFDSRWIFDVELLRRLDVIQDAEVADQIYELPLETWFERPGSKLRPRHFLLAVGELYSIFWRYRAKNLDQYQRGAEIYLNQVRQEKERGDASRTVATKAA
jgi:dolichyl-phosphate beta-glucosyltransferase